MKGAWCYDWEIKCALGRFYCECGLCCTYSSSPWCVWPCVTEGHPGAVWTEQSGLWASPFGWGWLPGPSLHPLSYAGLSSLPGLRAQGLQRAWQFRVKALKRTGFFIQRFYKFSLLLRLYCFIFWYWKVPIVVCGFFGVYGRASALYESSRSCHLMFAWVSPPSLAARQWGANSAYGKRPQKDFGKKYF